MQNLYKAPLLDSFISILLDYPLQAILFIMYFQYYSNSYRTVFIFLTTLFTNFLAAIIAYSYVYKTDLVKENRILKQALINISGIVLLFPIYTYYMLHFTNEETPFVQISIIIMFSYFIGLLLKTFATYIVWYRHNK